MLCENTEKSKVRLMLRSRPVGRLRASGNLIDISVGQGPYESSRITLKSQPGRVDVVYATASSGRPEGAALSSLFERMNVGR